MRERFTSRKFLLAVVAALVTFGNHYMGWGLSVEEVQQILMPIIAFIAAEGFADTASRFRSGK